VTGASAPNPGQDWLTTFITFGQFLSTLEDQLVATFDGRELCSIPLCDDSVPTTKPYVCGCGYDVHLSDGRQFMYDDKDSDDYAMFCVDMDSFEFQYYDGENWTLLANTSMLHFRVTPEDAYMH